MNRRDFLRVSAGALTAASTSAQTNRPPNVIMIYFDDLGYGDIGCYGSTNQTPNLDRMAKEGVRFTHFTSANPVCSPSRASLLTGRYPTRVGVPRVLFPTDKVGLPGSETTMAAMLKTRGYRTAAIGKWHLGHLPQFLPMQRGFDSYFGIPYSNDMTPRVLLENDKEVENPATLETLTARYTERATRFIEQSKSSPFFLYLAHTMPHIPLAASSRFRGKSPQGLYGDVVTELDWSCGEVLNAVKRAGLEQDTLVMVSSDNGPWFQGSPGRLRGRKGMTWEGGVREPFIARWPGRIKAGNVCVSLASMMDVAPTVAKLCGATPAQKFDGMDIWPLLAGERARMDRDVLLYFDDVHLQCARMDRWKLHVARYNHVPYSPAPASGHFNFRLHSPELYNLDSDPDESYDIAADHPEIVQQMMKRIEAQLADFPEPIRADWANSKASVEDRSGAPAHL